MTQVQPSDNTKKISRRTGSPSPLSLVKSAGEVRSEDTRQWTIKGLSPVTVEVTREAARASGMKLNSWVGQALEAAAENGIEKKTDPARNSDPVNMSRVEEELSRMRAKTEQLESTVSHISSLLLKLLAEQRA